MISKFYLPVVKSKQGEFDALFTLNPSIRGYVVPLIEIAKLEFDNSENAKPKTIETHLDNICKRISTKWGRSNAFIDTYLVNDTTPNGIDCISYVYERLARGTGIPLPIVQFSTPATIIASIKDAMRTYNIQEVGVRTMIPDILSPEFFENTGNLIKSIELNLDRCHLILDLSGADFAKTEDFVDTVIDHFQTFPFFQAWKSVTVCGGSFPKTNLLKVGINTVTRGEWIFYNKLVAKLQSENFSRLVNYGDYGIVAPGHFEYDPLKMDRSANIRYTHNDIWYVVKGKSLKTEGHEQYFELAKDIIRSGYFLGENFSAGDLHIKKCSESLTTSGNPTVWNKIGFNHHFSKVISDLSASYLAA